MEAGPGQFLQHLGMGLHRQSLSLAQCISKEIQRPPGRDFRVELPQRSGGGITGIGEQRLALFGPFPVQPLKCRFGHEHFAANFKTGRKCIGICLQHQRNRADRFYIAGDIFAHFSVAARCRPAEPPGLINQIDRQTINFQFNHIFHRSAGRRTHPVVKCPQFLGGKRVTQAEQRRSVGNLVKGGQRLSAYPLGRRIRRHQLGMACFDFLQAA